MQRDDLVRYFDSLLQPERFRDYCPNGLQVEGRTEIRLLASGVTASAALVEAAVEAGADALLVHHGYFWRGEDPRIIGPRRVRIGGLLAADMNLIAYHLPIDAHPELGNNARLGKVLGLRQEGRAGEQDLLAWGSLDVPEPLAAFSARVQACLDRVPMVIGDPARTVRRVAWCTGAAQDYFEQAVALGVDVFLTGEISEQSVHASRESGVAFVAAGHHATERYGVQAVGDAAAKEFGIVHRFLEIPNPV